MAAVPGKDPDDTQSTAPVSPESRHEGSEPPSANTNSPQQHGTRPSASGPAEPLDHSVTLPNPSNQERNPTKELSPLRPQFTASARGTSRSRKNSQESSPTRNATTTFANPLPSAAAVQRALSANKLPLQASGVESPVESRNSSSTDSPARWPSTPRLTSPPPSKIPRNSTHPNRKQDQDMTAANSSQKRSSASVPDLNITAGKPIPEKEDSLAPRSSLKTPARGGSVVTPTLETVAENSVPDAPPALPPSERSSASSPQEDPDRQKGTLQDPPQHKSANHSGESDSDTGESQPCGESVEKPGNGEGSKSSSTLAKKSSLNPAPNKAKSSEGPIRSMTVETETVSSVPQAPLNVTVERASSAKLDANGPVRLKASNEMIRPKKEKKKNIRRPTSINTGTSMLLLRPICGQKLTRNPQSRPRPISLKPRWPVRWTRPTRPIRMRRLSTSRIRRSPTFLAQPVTIHGRQVRPRWPAKWTSLADAVKQMAKKDSRASRGSAA